MGILCNLITFFVLFVFFFAPKITAKDEHGTLRFDIHRKASPFEQYVKYGKYFGRLVDQEMKKANRDNDSIALYRYLDDEFYTPVVLGHPGQILNAALDTTWTYTWFLSSKCSSIKAIGCFFHNLYDHSKSSEYKPDGRPFSGPDNMTGFFSYENISFAHSNVTNQLFIEMTQVQNSFVIDKADGVLGLGVKDDPNYDPFFYTLLKQKKIKNPIFSIYLNRDKQSNRGGNVMLGFVDVKHIHKTRVKNESVPDNFTYLQVDDVAFWQFNMDKIILHVNQTVTNILCAGGCKGVSDTSGNAIYGPAAEVAAIHDLINAREFFLHRYTVDCDTINKLPKIDFVLGGKNFTLSGPDYTIKMSYHSITICLSSFIPAGAAEDQNRWILGGSFLSAFYSVYNVQEKTIGFVKAN